MAFTHIHFDEQTQHGRKLRRLLSMMEESDDLLTDVREVMLKMRDGADNASDTTNYAELVNRFGFTSNDKAREAFLAINTAYQKTSGDASVTGVRSARDDLYARLWG